MAGTEKSSFDRADQVVELEHGQMRAVRLADGSAPWLSEFTSVELGVGPCLARRRELPHDAPRVRHCGQHPLRHG